jgi:ADP-ribose pyrophosphatase YjhB (NUDIX family)
MRPQEFYQHCPRCGASVTPPAKDVLRCPDCGFTIYFNPSIATAAFIQREDGRALFLLRAKEPSKGKLAPPGGFVNIGETAEAGSRREVREEVGLEITDVRYLCSQPNSYLYKEVTYPVLDFFFTARAVNPEKLTAADGEVAGIEWLDPLAVAPETMAFPSMQEALRVWQRQLKL